MATETTTTMIDDENKSGNKNAGEPKMMKPADIEKMEAEGHSPAFGDFGQIEDKKPPKKETSPKKEDKPKEEGGEGKDTGLDIVETILSEEELTAINAKVEKGEELSAEEQAKLVLLDRMVPEPSDGLGFEAGTVFRVAGKEFSPEEMWSKFKDDVAIPDLENSTPEQKKSLIEVYHKSLNRTEQSKSNQQNAEQNARDRVEIDRQIAKIDADRRELSIKREAAETESKRLTKERERLEKAATSTITKNDIYEIDDDGKKQIDPEKQREYNKKMDAIEALKDIKESETESKNAEIRHGQESTRLEISAFVARNPQYATERDPLQIFADIKAGRNVSKEDRVKVIEMDQIFREAGEAGVDPNDIYELRNTQRTLAVKPTVHTGRTGGAVPLPDLPNKQKSVLAKIANLREKAKAGATGLPGGGGGERATGKEKRDATKIVENDRKVLAADTDEFVVDSLGYK